MVNSRSMRGPTVIFPTFLKGNGPEYEFARRSYFLREMLLYLNKYRVDLVKYRAKHLLKNKKD